MANTKNLIIEILIMCAVFVSLTGIASYFLRLANIL